VASMHETGVNIWRILDIPGSDVISDGVDTSTDPETRSSWEKVLEMDLNVRTNLIASALSNDGHWLIVSDMYEAKLFELSTNVSNARNTCSYGCLIFLALGCR
jgi:U3 small nucleolar RNA-associated protein 4